MLTLALVLMVVVPALAGMLAGALRGPFSRIMAVTASAVVAALAVWTSVSAYGTAHLESVGGMPWLGGASAATAFGVLLDPLGSILLIVVTMIGLLTIVYSTRYLGAGNREHPVPDSEHPRYYFWLLLFLASMVGVAVSPNFLQLFMFWELTTVCSWALISYYRNEASLAAGFKALVVTQVGGAFFLVAILLLFARTGSFDFAALALLPDRLRLWVFVLLLVAAWAKAAQVPFHTWLPDAMAAPTPISAYLHAAAMVKAGVFLMARSASAGWVMPAEVGMLMGAMALLTLLVALTYYFIQDDLKRLLAYSTIAHLGYVLLGISLGALGSTVGFRGGVLHIICHGFSKATLFFSVGAIACVTGSRSISALGGLAKTMPLTATAFFVGVLAVTGVPPFGCFWSKFMILSGAIQLGGAIGTVLLVLVLLESLIAFAWMVYVGQKVFFGERTPVACVNSDPPAAMSGVLVALMIGCLLAPAVGIPLVQWIGR
jgi:hydrogenase-4 component D